MMILVMKMTMMATIILTFLMLNHCLNLTAAVGRWSLALGLENVF